MNIKHFKAMATILLAGCVAVSANVINREASNTTLAASFFNNCQSFSIGKAFKGSDEGMGNKGISAEGLCEDAHKTLRCSVMHLNRCYENVDGVLRRNSGTGAFYNSCENCRLNGSWLLCDCWKGFRETAKLVPALANLDEHLYVTEEGVLGCPGNEGEMDPSFCL